MLTKLARRKYFVLGGLALFLALSAALGTFVALSRGTRGMPTAPPYVNPTSEYADVVATVNGEPISGIALAQVEAAAIEAAKKWPENVPLPQGDPLDCLINQLLLVQAADRLGLMPTRAEVQEYVRMWEERLNNLPADQRLEYEALMAAQGLSTENLTADEKHMAAYEGALKLVNVGKYIREQVAREQGIPVDQVKAWDVSKAEKAFLAAERARADIVVLVDRPTPTPLPTLRLPTPRTPILAPTTATTCW